MCVREKKKIQIKKEKVKEKERKRKKMLDTIRIIEIFTQIIMVRYTSGADLRYVE